MAFVGLDHLDVWTLDPAVNIQIIPEGRAGDGLVEMTLNRRLVWLSHGPVPVNITSEEPEADISVGQAVAINILYPKDDSFSRRNSSELGREAASVDGYRTD